GKVQLRTRNREAFAHRLAPVRADEVGGGAGAGAATAGAAAGNSGGGGNGGSSELDGVTEEDMLALFRSIDVDGSGAIDVSELQTAFELLGISKSTEEVTELLDGVDEDGSGELEFPEFKAVLLKAIRGGGASNGRGGMSEWHEAVGGGHGGGGGGGGGGVRGSSMGSGCSFSRRGSSSGSASAGHMMWQREMSTGAALGEAAMLDPDPPPQDGVLMALVATDLLLLERADYEHILENGFDGELKAKMALLRSSPVLGSALHRTDLRRLAYAMERRTTPMHAALYEQGQPPAALHLILEGSCKV
ncbi:hypothetical protein Agub_g6194, partial [Astrephomene gubernaculifera]